MKQFQIAYQGDEAFRRELNAIRRWRGENPSYAVVFRIYSADMNLDHIRHVCDILDEQMPDALYVGCTANGNILSGALTASKIILTCTVFERQTTRVALMQLPFSEENIKRDVDGIKAFCEQNPWVNTVEIHATRLGMPVRAFFDELQTLREDIQIYGGSAFNPDPNDITTAVFSKGSEFSNHSIVLLLMGGEDLHTYSMYISGWKPLRRRFKVTKANRLMLCELDGEPAFNIYQRFLNIEKNDQLVSNTMEFPLFMDYNGTDVMRCLLGVTEDNAIMLTSIVPETTSVRLAYGDFETILSTIRSAGQKIADFKPEAIEVFSCASRRAFWGDESISSETSQFNGVAPTAGFYTGGEFLRMDGVLYEFDATLVFAAMREGEPRAGEAVRIRDGRLGDQDSKRVPLIRRFVSFIDASTADYEELTRQLAITSVTDALTGLYNRGEIERRIRAALDGRARRGAPSLVMLDIDDFKRVNDVYGHQEGDRVIIALADTLREVTDGMDAALGRWGGEEFMVLLPGRDRDEAAALAERIRARYASVAFQAAGCQTVSLGVAQARDGEDADALYSRVDRALYTAKAAGKNRVVTLD